MTVCFFTSPKNAESTEEFTVAEEKASEDEADYELITYTYQVHPTVFTYEGKQAGLISYFTIKPDRDYRRRYPALVESIAAGEESLKKTDCWKMSLLKSCYFHTGAE